MMNRCPECDAPLGASAIACRCGWRNGAKQMVVELIPCAHESCGQSALCRIKTPTGWARLCLPHYEQHFAEQGRRAMTEYGLDRQDGVSHEEWKKTVMEAWKELAMKSTVSKRWIESPS